MKDMELKIRKWLSGARDRDGGRSRSRSGVSIPHDHDRDNEAGEPRNRNELNEMRVVYIVMLSEFYFKVGKIHNK